MDLKIYSGSGGDDFLMVLAVKYFCNLFVRVTLYCRLEPRPIELD